MKTRLRLFALILCICLSVSSMAFASFEFSDDRFQGVFTTGNIDKIIEEYELFDGWYWTVPKLVTQTFHGMKDISKENTDAGGLRTGLRTPARTEHTVNASDLRPLSDICCPVNTILITNGITITPWKNRAV